MDRKIAGLKILCRKSQLPQTVNADFFHYNFFRDVATLVLHNVRVVDPINRRNSAIATVFHLGFTEQRVVLRYSDMGS